MKRLLAALALAALPLAAGNALAAPVTAAPAKPLDRLVAILLPQQTLLDLGARAFDSGLRGEVAASPELRSAQARHPGLTAHVAGELRPAFLKAMKKELPSLRREIRAVVSDSLSDAEVADALAFFASPTGAKLLKQVYAMVAEKPDQPPEALQAAVMASAMKNMQTSDIPALMTFGASSAAGKMGTLNPKIAQTSKAWSDRFVAKYRPRMRSLAAASGKRYLKGKK